MMLPLSLGLHGSHFVLHAQDHAKNVGLERRGKASAVLVRDRADMSFGGARCSPRHQDGQTVRRSCRPERGRHLLRTSVLMNSASEPKERSSLTSASPASSRRPANDHVRAFLAKATAAGDRCR